GDQFELVVGARTSDDPHQLTCSYEKLATELRPGDPVLFADGTIAMAAREVDKTRARLEVTLGGTLRSNQGVNLPGATLGVSALTEKDLRDLDWTATREVEYVALSFVRSAHDVTMLRDELARRGSRARIVSKIEKPQALDEIEAIVAESDAVMVARGDLGV